MNKQVSWRVLPVTTVNQGASFGPRISTVTFETAAAWKKPRLDVRFIADIDGSQFQDEGGVRRRAARALVGVGRRAADAISSGACQPNVVLVHRDPAWASANWEHAEEYEGLGRWVRATADFWCEDQEPNELRAPDDLRQNVATVSRTVADDLHATIDDPSFVRIFGGK